MEYAFNFRRVTSSSLLTPPSTPVSPAFEPPPRSVSCPQCGWVESQGDAECRSCGTSLVGAQPFVQVYAPEPRHHEVRAGATAAPSEIGAVFPVRKALVALLLLFLGWYSYSNRRVHHPAGILVKEEPKQGPVPEGKKPWPGKKNASITPLATYDITARVLQKERYRWDPVSDISPLDLGVGWGVMSDEMNAVRCTFGNNGRYLTWHWEGADFPAEQASTSMGNMHMLPANDDVRSQLLDLKEGQIFRAQGYLVEVIRPNSMPWTSSLTRLDTGMGACEIMWVERVAVKH